jgi:hypothetical protein
VIAAETLLQELPEKIERVEIVNLENKTETLKFFKSEL